MSRSTKQLEKNELSEYQAWVKRLRAAANKRKADLRRFVEHELKITNVENYTVARLELAALQKIMEITLPDGRDPVGFGRHSASTYQALYCTRATRAIVAGL